MLVLRYQAVSPLRAQARETDNEFNAVSVTFKYTTAYNSEKNESSMCKQ